MQIKYLPTARLDLLNILDHYREVSSRSLAHRMIKQIRAEIGVLADYAELAPAYELVPDIRRLVVANGSYLVFHRASKYVEILHIRRSEREPAITSDLNIGLMDEA